MGVYGIAKFEEKMGDIYLLGKKQTAKNPEPPSRLEIIKIFAGMLDLRFSLLVHKIYSNYADHLDQLPFHEELEKLIGLPTQR